MNFKKILAGTLSAVTIFSFAGASLFSPAPANAATAAELEAQVAALLAQIAALSGGASTSCTSFSTDLTIGSTGEAVRLLQVYLNKKGFTVAASGAGSTGMESTYFGGLTQSALAKYQASVGISPAAGYFGPITRAKVNADCVTTGGGSTGGGSTGSGDLEGGAGSVESYDLISGLNNEEVGEDESDVEVAGLEIEADDGSDLRFTAVRLVFDEGTAGSDFEDYADEVSVWLDGEEVARVDGDEFNDDNDWTKTVSLDDSAIIKAGETGELTVAVSGISNLDSADEGDTWTVDFRQVRFVDADGATISEDPTTAVRTFSFESFAAATGAELKVSLSDADDINDAHVIDIDDADDTDDVEIFSFTLEAEGDSDLTIDEIPVHFTAVGFNLNDGLSGASLWMDGDAIGTENFTVAATTSTINFDDLDIEIGAGDEVEFTVSVDIGPTSGAVDNGDTIMAQIGQTEREAMDVEDESGEDLANGDRTGVATGDAHALYDEGIMVEFISADADITSVDGTSNDQGVFRIKIAVTAFGADAFLDRTFAQSTSTSASPAGANRVAILTSGGTVATTTGMTITRVGGDSADELSETFEIEDGDTVEFEITMITVDPGASVRGVLYGLEWGIQNEATTDFVYTFDMGVDGDYKTGFVFVND